MNGRKNKMVLNGRRMRTLKKGCNDFRSESNEKAREKWVLVFVTVLFVKMGFCKIIMLLCNSNVGRVFFFLNT